ncbi:regulator of g-protein signaling 22 [Pitangus sulphuratus]|nr:regulator of g-protein signaling 22 [Pitangus sulphuratus]
MQSKRLTTEPPCITEEVFEECLATDDMLVDYFNEFLSLPTFAQPVKFNSDFGVFEVVNYAPRCLESQLKKNLHDQKPPNPIYDVLRKAKNDGQLSKMHSASPTFSMDPNYNTMCLDREQAIQWIKKERLPAFLGSDCYFEYRLAKLISQVEWSKTGMNFIIDSDYDPWIRKQDLSSPHPEEDDTSLTMKKFYVSLGQATVSQVKDWFTLAKQGDSMRTTDSSTHPVASSQIQNIQYERDKSSSEKDSLLEAGSLSKECQQESFLSPSRTASAKADATSERSSEAEEGSSVAIAEPPSHRQLRVYLEPKWDSEAKEENEQERTTSQKPEEFMPAYTQKEPISELTHQPAGDSVARSTAESLFKQSSSPLTALDSKGDVRKRDPEEVSLSSSSESGGPDSRAAWCISHGTYDTGNRHEFERFKKFIKGTLGERYWWLWMDIERLKALKNTTRQQRSKSVSTDMIHCLALDGTKDSRYQGYRKYTYAELLRGKSAAGSVVLGGSRMESMLQSLYLENRAGYYFTQFCEESGNKLWKNCVYFWFDLQAYHQLFYQETLQPFQICKQAQFLYATYIAPSASMDIGLHQNKRNMIYQKMDPAFEDLFDPAEEYILTILLEPWMKMVEADKYTYGKVELVGETRQLDSVCFTKLQALHQVSDSKEDESTVADSGLPSFPDDQYLHQVPKGLARPSLSDLIHDKEKLKQFWAFLNEHSAGMDLMCWLDIEEFRKMLHKDKEKSDAMSKDIGNKYLNDEYFFGPNSPATREQQEKHMDNKCVSSSSEIIAFRKALLDPVTASLFQRFVSLQGDLLGNGVLFWQEVQKYKDLCHSHCADAIVQKKITAIINCFINSAIPPALQIDIPPEQAKKILERRKELGPYIFREAQMSVFALLFKFWPEFCKLQSNVDSEKILLALEREKEKKMRKKQGITAKGKEAERKLINLTQLSRRALTQLQKSALTQLQKSALTQLPRSALTQMPKGSLTQLPKGVLVDQIDLKRESAPSLDGFGWEASWSYSKYIEALEQERILIKREEDLEETSSFLSGSLSMSSLNPDEMKDTISTKRKLSNVPKTQESKDDDLEYY